MYSNDKALDIKGLMELCHVKSPQVMLMWVKANLHKINTGEAQAEKVGKRWLFNAQAVEVILSLRRVGSPVAKEVIDNARIIELEQDKSSLTENVIRGQALVAQHRQELVELKDRLLNTYDAIAEARGAEAQAIARAEIAEAKLELALEQVKELKQEKEQLLNMLSSFTGKKKKKRKK